MGVVYEARDPNGEAVALKAILNVTEDRRLRFLREADVMRFVGRHPNVVGLRAIGEDRGCLFLTMDLLPGTDFSEFLQSPLFDRRKAAGLLVGAARGVHYAHEAGVLHRDLKPANLFLTGDTLVVMDFGLAKDMQSDAGLTKDGALVGTVVYMAPEQVRGKGNELDRTVDVYALGVILYEILAGRRPFSGQVTEIMSAILERPPPPVANVPARLEAVCQRALAKDPGDRFPTAEHFARALEAALSDGEKARRWPLFASLSANLGLAVFVSVLAVSRAAPSAAALPPEPHPPSPQPEPRPKPEPESETPPFNPNDPFSRPAWVEALPPALRPPVPLPRGLLHTLTPGEYLCEADQSILVWIPAGSFVFGGSGDRKAKPKTFPVRFTEGYFIGKYELSSAQWTRFRDETGYDPPLEKNQQALTEPGKLKPDEPAGGVCWTDAVAYCEWAGLRLPSEAEWEYAARGNLPIRFPWGNESPSASHANVGPAYGSDEKKALGKRDGYLVLSPVGNYPLGASPFGCLDMAGNCAEWVADHYVSPDSAPPPDGSAVTDPARPLRRLRGGSYYLSGNKTFATLRPKGVYAGRRRPGIAFRVAISAR
jgi:serine/threonine protein kinase